MSVPSVFVGPNMNLFFKSFNLMVTPTLNKVHQPTVIPPLVSRGISVLSALRILIKPKNGVLQSARSLLYCPNVS